MTEQECQQVFSLLSEFVNGELDPETARQIERHIEGCQPCVAFLDSLKRSVSLCRHFHPQEEPAQLPAEVRDRFLAAYRKAMAGR